MPESRTALAREYERVTRDLRAAIIARDAAKVAELTARQDALAARLEALVPTL